MENKKNHTDSPWILNVTDSAIEKHKGYVLVQSQEGNEIALVKLDENHLGNAPLISAAPDMLGALTCAYFALTVGSEASKKFAIKLVEEAINKAL